VKLEVVSAGDEIEGSVGPSAKVELDAKLGILRCEGRYREGQIAAADPLRAEDRERALGAVVLAFDGLVLALELAKDPLGELEVLAALLG
jgi:hypothetical protein